MNKPAGKRILKDSNHVGPKVNPWLSLAQGIIYQAILDWRTLDAGRVVPGVNYISLRNFLRSPWCDTLLLFTDIEPEVIVESLERHSRELKI